MPEKPRGVESSLDSPIPADLEHDRVLTIAQAAVIAGVSVATLRREIKAGRGPRVTWLSMRRCGIRVRHLREWLDARMAA